MPMKALMDGFDRSRRVMASEVALVGTLIPPRANPLELRVINKVRTGICLHHEEKLSNPLTVAMTEAGFPTTSNSQYPHLQHRKQHQSQHRVFSPYHSSDFLVPPIPIPGCARDLEELDSLGRYELMRITICYTRQYRPGNRIAQVNDGVLKSFDLALEDKRDSHTILYSLLALVSSPRRMSPQLLHIKI